MIEKLNLYINKHSGTEFVWGINDCCTFASNWVEVCLGKNPLKDIEFYGKYSTKIEAKKILVGLGGIHEVLNNALGDSIHPVKAKAGDIVMGELDEGKTLGICLGIDSIFLGHNNFISLPTITMKNVWSM